MFSMNSKWFIIICLTLSLGVALLPGTYSLPKGAKALLPPPDEGAAADGKEGEGEDGEPARGLKGAANPLASAQKTFSKCSTEGSYGVLGECSKYLECKK
jgi:hypothetical protein